MNKYGILEQWEAKVKDKDNVAVWRWWNGTKNKEEKEEKVENKSIMISSGIQEIVERKQRELWKERVMEKKKGQFYLKCKREWKEEKYMNEKGSKKGRIWKTRMRAGAVPLQAELFREHRSYSDKCCVCGIRAVENQQHMLIECTAYQHERSKLFIFIESKIDEAQRNRVWNSGEELTVWLLSNIDCDQPIRTFLDAAFTRRSFLLGGLHYDHDPSPYTPHPP